MTKDVYSNDDLVAITYLSHSLIRNSELEKECKNIETVASAHNASEEISGLLLYCRYRFIQRLEGRRDRVDKLINRIKTDLRHRNFTVLYYGIITERYFPDWSHMQVVTEGKDLGELDELFVNLEAGSRDVLNDKESRFVLNFIQHFAA